MKKFIIIFCFIYSSILHAEILEIIKVGHPTLRFKAQELTHSQIDTAQTQKLIQDMLKTMSNAGGVGLAAPQVNHSLRMFVMKSFPRVSQTVVINPDIDYLEAFGQQDSTEGCLSIPGKTVRVKRYRRIHLKYINQKGQLITEEMKGLKAIIAQHEFDHLNGVLIIDLAENFASELNFEKYFKVPLM